MENSPEVPERRVHIREMPSQELLEMFLTRLATGQRTNVVFDTDEGRFVYLANPEVDNES